MNALWALFRPLLSTTVRFMHISYIEAKSSYEGSKLGILWIPGSTLLFSLLLALVFHSGGPKPPLQFFLYVLAGYVTWNFIADSISGSTNIIQSKLDFAVHNNLTLAGLFGKMLSDRLFDFGLNVVMLIVAVLILAPFSLGPHLLLFVPLLAMLSVTSLGVSYLVNLMTLFFPDLANVIRTLVRLMLFASPVFWFAGDAGGVRLLLERYNPAAYFLKMSRQAFGVEPVNWPIWAVGLALTLIFGIAGVVAYWRSHAFVRNLK